MTALDHDLRLAVRVLLGTKTWTLVVLVSLALGIGANTASAIRFTVQRGASRRRRREHGLPWG